MTNRQTYQDTVATSDTQYIAFPWMSADANGENLFLFMAPTHPLTKLKKRPSKWLQKQIKRRGWNG